MRSCDTYARVSWQTLVLKYRDNIRKAEAPRVNQVCLFLVKCLAWALAVCLYVCLYMYVGVVQSIDGLTRISGRISMCKVYISHLGMQNVLSCPVLSLPDFFCPSLYYLYPPRVRGDGDGSWQGCSATCHICISSRSANIRDASPFVVWRAAHISAGPPSRMCLRASRVDDLVVRSVV